MPFLIKHVGLLLTWAGGILHAWVNLPKELTHMIKSLENIAETIIDPKYVFRKTDHQPKKPQKHRYERRKIKEFLHLEELSQEPAT